MKKLLLILCLLCSVPAYPQSNSENKVIFNSLDRIENKIDKYGELVIRNESRISSLEKSMDRIIGAIGILSLFVLGQLVNYFMKKKGNYWESEYLDGRKK